MTTLTLNRPDKRNALNVELLEQLVSALEATELRSSQRVLVLRGAGRVFCAGMDLAEATDASRLSRSAELIETSLRRLTTSRLVSIAVVQGAALAGGAGLMTACDFVIADHHAKFGYPEVRRGLVPALIMTFLRRQLRERDARELLLLGEPIDAQKALTIGLINRAATNEGALEAHVTGIITSILQGGPETIVATKAALHELWPSALDRDFDRAHRVHIAARGSAEALEGVAAFHEKRPPAWAATPHDKPEGAVDSASRSRGFNTEDSEGAQRRDA